MLILPLSRSSCICCRCSALSRGLRGRPGGCEGVPICGPGSVGGIGGIGVIGGAGGAVATLYPGHGPRVATNWAFSGQLVHFLSSKLEKLDQLLKIIDVEPIIAQFLRFVNSFLDEIETNIENINMRLNFLGDSCP